MLHIQLQFVFVLIFVLALVGWVDNRSIVLSLKLTGSSFPPSYCWVPSNPCFFLSHLPHNLPFGPTYAPLRAVIGVPDSILATAQLSHR